MHRKSSDLVVPCFCAVLESTSLSSIQVTENFVKDSKEIYSMNPRFTVLSRMAALSVMAILACTAFAQEQSTQRPMFKHPIPHFDDNATPATALQVWNGSFVYQNKTNKFVMVGTDPSATNVTTTVPVYIIPVKFGFVNGTKKYLFDPTKPIGTGLSAVQQTLASPIFQSSIDYVQGGTDIGTTQYEDAFQRGRS